MTARRRVPLREAASLLRDQVDPSRLDVGVVRLFSIPAFDEGRRPELVPPSTIKSNKFRVPVDAVLVSKLNPHTPRIWIPTVREGDLAIASTEFLVLQPKAGVDRRFLAYACQSPSFVETMAGRRSGTTGSHQRVGAEDALDIEIALPELDEQRAVGDILAAIDSKIDSNAEVVRATQGYLDASLGASESISTRLDTIAEFEDNRRVPISRRVRVRRPGPYPYYGAAGVIDHIDSFIFDGVRVLVAEDGARVALPDGRPLVQLVSGKFWVNNHAHVLSGKTISAPLLAALLRCSDVRHLVTGTAQPKLSKGNLSSLLLQLPIGQALAELDEVAKTLFGLERGLLAERRRLIRLLNRLVGPLVEGTMPIAPQDADAA